MTSELSGDIWRRAFAKAGIGEKCCLGCGHEVIFWERDGVWGVRNLVLCEKTPGNCLVTELKIAGNRRGIKVVEDSTK